MDAGCFLSVITRGRILINFASRGQSPGITKPLSDPHTDLAGEPITRKGGELMSKYYGDQHCWSRGEVSDARLHQHAGPQYAFGGWEKVSNGDGSYWMRPTQQ